MLDEGLETLTPPSREAATERQRLERDWRLWVPAMFPGYITDEETGEVLPFAAHQERAWDHVWSVRRGVRPAPFVGLWGRGLTKSTTAEMATVSVGARRIKRYGFYVCGTQDQADDHLNNIGDMLGAPMVEELYPELARRDVSKYGTSKGWKRNRLRTAAGFTIDAIGLDVARSRGAKLEETRPDWMVLDDIDDQEDSDDTIAKKMRALTRKILPAGAVDLAVLFIQNLIHDASIASLLESGEAPFLHDREVSGPVPAIYDLHYDEDEYKRTGRVVIESGRPAWAGMNIQRAQEIANYEGGEAFLVERQHMTHLLGGTIYRPEFWHRDETRFLLGDPSVDPWTGDKDDVIGRYLFFDTAYKDKDSSSDTACVGLELLASWRVRMCHLWSGHLEFPYLLKTIEDTALDWNEDGALSGVVIEDKASGISAIQTLWLAAPEWLADLLDALEPGTRSKDEKDRQAAQYARMGGVLMPYADTAMPEFREFIAEVTKSRPVKRDRRDALTLGILYLERWLSQWHRAEMRRLSGMTAVEQRETERERAAGLAAGEA